MRFGANLLLTPLVLALTVSVGRSELTGKTAENWDMSLILVGRRAEKQCVHSCVYSMQSLQKLGRSLQQLQVWLAMEQSLQQLAKEYLGLCLCHLCLMSPVFLALEGSAPVICTCPSQDQDILALQHKRTALWAALCLFSEMKDATAEHRRAQCLRAKPGTSKALPYCSSLLSHSAHQAALMLQLCLEGTCGRTPAALQQEVKTRADHQPSWAAPALSPALAWLSLGEIQQPAGVLENCRYVVR